MTPALSAQAEALLPGADEAPRCADHQRQLEIDPGGTAIDADLLVLIDIPLPWPAKMADHPWLGGRPIEVTVAAGQARLVGVVPPADAHRYRLRTLWRDGARTSGAQRWFDDEPGLAGILSELDRTDAAGLAEHWLPASTDNLVLVCGHGSRDRCCGTDGTRLAIELRASRPDIEVERTSHLGGHRFAPTALTAKSGRMWAHLDLETTVAIIDRSVPTADVAPRCRGWWGTPMGAAQVAERAAFAAHGWGLDDVERNITRGVEADEWVTTWPGGEHHCVVHEARQVPTITCRAAGGRPAKPGVEYRVAPRSADHG